MQLLDDVSILLGLNFNMIPHSAISHLNIKEVIIPFHLNCYTIYCKISCEKQKVMLPIILWERDP